MGQRKPASTWVSGKAILFFLLLLPVGFILTLTGTAQGALFGPGILLWVVGVFGSVYCIIRRLWGPKAAKMAVLFLFLILLWKVFSNKREDRDRDPFGGRR